MKYKFLLSMAALVLAAGTLNGCVALGIGAAGAAGGVEYAEGRASSTVDASVERVYNASVAALQAKDMPIKHKALEGDKADINAEYDNGDEIRIDIASKDSNTSVLHVRVGMTGNREIESELMEAIKKRV